MNTITLLTSGLAIIGVPVQRKDCMAILHQGNSYCIERCGQKDIFIFDGEHVHRMQITTQTMVQKTFRPINRLAGPVGVLP